MLLVLDSVLQEQHQIPQLGAANKKFILETGVKYGFKQEWSNFIRKGEWDGFYKKYKRCYGVIELSDVVFSSDNQRAAFFIQCYRGGLDGWGGVVFMKKTEKDREVDLALQFWIS